MNVRVSLFGGLRVTVDGREVSRFRTTKTAHVVAILAIHAGAGVRRDTLTEWLWPSAAPSAALNSLSQALAALRRELGDALASDRQSVALRATTDVQEFLALATAAAGSSPEDVVRRTRLALESMRGPFLPGVLEPWAVHERLRLADCAQSLLSRWWECATTLAERLDAARMSTVLQPTSEEAATRLIELLFEADHVREAEAEYRRFQGRLAGELGMKPSAALSRLVLERVRQSVAPTWWVLSPDREPESVASPEAALARGRTLARQGVPVQIARAASSIEVSAPGLHWRVDDTPELSKAIGGARMVSAGPDFVRLVEPLPGGALPRRAQLVGREALLERAFAELATTTRLLTLVGPGGNGKSRLAIALGERALAEGERVAWVGLAEVRSVDRLWSVAAESLGAPGDDPLEAIAFEFDQPTLLILDNLEQIEGDLRMEIERALTRMPHLRMVATSRRRIGSPDERQLEVPPLDADTGADVELFLLRAPILGLMEAQTEQVRRLCRAVGGSPLAIELIAARTAVLSLAEIESRLDEALDWPHRERAASDRQHTLRSTVEWSLALLKSGPRQTLEALACLNAPASPELLLALTGDRDVAEHLLDLNEASLVVLGEGSGQRANLLDTIRTVVRTTPGAESASFRGRLVGWAVEFAEAQAARLQGAAQKDALDRLSEEHEHLRQALALAIQAGAEDALRLGNALWRFWHLRSHLSEGAEWLKRALAAVPDGPTRAGALNGLGRLAYLQGDYATAEQAHLEVLGIEPDDDARALALNGLGAVAYERGSYDAALVAFEEALSLRVALGDRFGEGNALNWIGLTLTDAGRHDEAVVALERSLEVRREIGDESGMARSLGWLGTVARRLGERVRAEELYQQALAIHTGLGDRRGQAGILGNLGLVARDGGDAARAMALFEEAQSIHTEIGDRWGVATMLLERGRTRGESGAQAEALNDLQRARALREAMGSVPGVAEVDEAIRRYSRP